MNSSSLRLRMAVKTDLDPMLAIYTRAVRTSSVSFEYEPPTLADFTERFTRITAMFPWLVAVREGAALGYAYAEHPFSRAAYQWTADCALYIHEDARRCGLGRKLIQTLSALLTAQGIQKLYGVIVASNTASIELTTALGFGEEARMTRVGCKQGQWHDVVWMGKALTRLSDIPEPPCPVSALPPELVQNVLAAAVA